MYIPWVYSFCIYNKKSHKFCSLLKDLHIIWYAFYVLYSQSMRKNYHAFYRILMWTGRAQAQFIKLTSFECESVQKPLVSFVITIGLYTIKLFTIWIWFSHIKRSKVSKVWVLFHSFHRHKYLSDFERNRVSHVGNFSTANDARNI